MTSKQKIVIAAILVVAGIGGLVAIHGNRAFPVSIARAATEVLAPEVDVAKVELTTIMDFQKYLGRVEAIDKMEIFPLVPGAIVGVHSKDGALVRKGDALFSIDPRPFVAEVNRARAKLAAGQGRSGYAASEAARENRLLADNAIARRDYDQAQNAAHEAAANLKAVQAALETASVNLSYIVAPVSVQVSRAELTLGNVVSTGASALLLLTTLVSVSPIYASFDMDEQTYLRYESRGSRTSMPVSLGIANEEGFSRKGRADSIDSQLDTGSGTIRVWALFDNGDGALVPGLYARIKVGGGAPHPAVLVNVNAIGTDQDKRLVMVVDAGNRARYRKITPGKEMNGFAVFSKGLAPGERLVVNGLRRIRPARLCEA